MACLVTSLIERTLFMSTLTKIRTLAPNSSGGGGLSLQGKIYLLSRVQLLSYFQVLVRIDMDDLARGLITLVVTVCFLVTSDFKYIMYCKR